jgi:hypothetical protein
LASCLLSTKFQQTGNVSSALCKIVTASAEVLRTSLRFIQKLCLYPDHSASNCGNRDTKDELETISGRKRSWPNFELPHPHLSE